MTEIARPRLESLNRIAIFIVITSLSYTGYSGYREQAARDQLHEYHVDNGYPFYEAGEVERRRERNRENLKSRNAGPIDVFNVGIGLLLQDPNLTNWEDANRQWTKPLEREIRDAEDSRQTAVFLNLLLAFILPIYYFKKRKTILGVEESTASPD